jgi:cytochrome b6-f complex iron-sulfur subunit
MRRSNPLPISRRSFLLGTLSVSGTVAGIGFATPVARFVYPVNQAPPAQKVPIAPVSALEPAGSAIEFEYAGTPCSLLQLADGTYRALSRICTHLGCIVGWREEEGDFFCPCHAGIFSPEGEVLAGPPPRALPSLSLELADEQIWATGWQKR